MFLISFVGMPESHSFGFILLDEIRTLDQEWTGNICDTTIKGKMVTPVISIVVRASRWRLAKSWFKTQDTLNTLMTKGQ